MYNKINSNTKAKEGYMITTLKLINIVKRMPIPNLSISKKHSSVSFYIDNTPYKNWVLRTRNKHTGQNFINQWDSLYKNQKGICPLCGLFLNYFNERNLQIRYIVKPLITYIDNTKIEKTKKLMLVHTGCYKERSLSK